MRKGLTEKSVKMGYFGALLVALTIQSVIFASEGCPPPNDISPCTCDGEGVSCMRASSIDQIKKAFLANYPEGGALYVYIQGTPITELPADTFNKFKAQNFYIEVNKLKKIDMKCFDHTKNYIRSLSFFGNELANFDFSYVQDWSRLRNLNLGRNKIKTVPSNAFNNNALVSITLAKNEIDNIGHNAFLHLPSLRKLDLSLNKLTSLGDFSIALLSQVPGLQVNLMGNQIASIAETAFHNARPQVLLLGFNRLSVLKETVFGSLLSVMSQRGGIVEVSGNPITCTGCDHAWIADNKQVLHPMIIGFLCPDGIIGVLGLTRPYLGC